MIHLFIFFFLFFSSTFSTLDYAATVGQTSDSIVAISAGEVHLTIVSAVNGDITNLRIDFYNATDSSLTNLYQSFPKAIQNIKQCKGINNQTKNLYYIDGPEILIQLDNFSISAYSEIMSIGVDYRLFSCFGSSQVILYQLYSIGGKCQFRKIDSQQQILFIIFINSSIDCRDISYRNQKVFILTYNTITDQILLQIYDEVQQLIVYSSSQPNINAYTNQQIQVSDPFYAILNGPNIFVYFMNNNTQICSFTQLQNVADIKITDHWIYLSLSTQVKQYDIGSCLYFSNFLTSTSMLLQVHEVSAYSTYNRLFLWSPGSSSIQVLNVQDRYRCQNGCNSCINYYGIDGNGQCFYTGVDNNQNQPISPNNSSLYNFTNTSINISYIQLNQNKTYFNHCFQSNSYQCLRFCEYKCQNCQINYSNCTSCSNFRSLENEACQMIFLNDMLITAVNVLNSYKSNSIRMIFFFIQNFELFQYHKIYYTKIVGDVIDEINYLESEKWSLISMDLLRNFIERRFFGAAYNIYTNSKFLETERKHSLLFETTKSYYILFLPLNLIVFFILNRMFYFLFSFKISQILRVYSFWLQYIFVTVIGSSVKLAYLSFLHFSILFSFDYTFKLLHFISIFVIGIFVVILLSFVILSEYFHGSFHKYFLPNVYKVKYSMLYSFCQLSLKPIIVSAVHAFLFNDGKLQLLLLAVVQTLYLILAFFLQIKLGIFKTKALMVLQNWASFSFVMITLLLYLKHFSQQVYDVQTENVVEQIVTFFIYLMACIIALSIIYVFLVNIFSLWGKANKKKFLNEFNKEQLKFSVQKNKKTAKLTNVKQRIQSYPLNQIKFQAPKRQPQNNKMVSNTQDLPIHCINRKNVRKKQIFMQFSELINGKSQGYIRHCERKKQKMIIQQQIL